MFQGKFNSITAHIKNFPHLATEIYKVETK